MDMSINAMVPFWGVSILILLLTFLFCCYLQYLRRQGRQERLGFRKATVLEKVEHVGKMCAVCLDEFKLRDQLAVPPCRHVFHVSCLTEWLAHSPTCPLCKVDIYSDSETLGESIGLMTSTDASSTFTTSV